MRSLNKLEFGGGERPRKKFYTQVDIRKTDYTDIISNSWDIEKYIDHDTITHIYSRHFFEHLTYYQARKTLSAWYKICRKNAEIELICPNMEFHLDQWQKWDKLSSNQKRWCLAGLWGWQRCSDAESWDTHKSGYDFKKLKELLEEYQFINIININRSNILNPHLHVKFQK